MSNSVFRSSSLDRVSSPEQLNDYIRLSKPSVWLVLIATIVILIGVVVWSIFGTLTTTQATVAVSNEGSVVCLVTVENAAKIAVGMEVRIGDNVGDILAISGSPILVSENFDSYVTHLGGFQVGQWVYQVQVQLTVADGVYPAQIVIEKLSPMSFVLN